MELYEPFPSKRRNKKYSVYVLKDGRPTLISFGDSRYGQFRDRLGWYSGTRILIMVTRDDAPCTMRVIADYTASYWAARVLW